MKKLLYIAVVLIMSSMTLYAKTQVVILGTNQLSTDSISASSTTATLAAVANTSRRGILFKNKASYSVYVSSYLATSTSKLYSIDANSEFNDNIECYLGEWYILTEAGQSSATVEVIEKSSPSY